LRLGTRGVWKAAITVDLVSCLIAEQFPQWTELGIRPVALGGWDNATFRLGDDMSVRVPSHQRYVAQLDKEHRSLPVFAPHPPLQQRPSADSPHPRSPRFRTARHTQARSPTRSRTSLSPTASTQRPPTRSTPKSDPVCRSQPALSVSRYSPRTPPDGGSSSATGRSAEQIPCSLARSSTMTPVRHIGLLSVGIRKRARTERLRDVSDIRAR
jgi:hypothetical protein